MSGWSPDDDDDSATAAEYVLGLLSPEDMALAERRLAEDAAFRELVRDWTEQLATLTDDIPPITPPPPIRDQVMRRLFPEPAEAGPGLLRRWGLWPLLLGGAVAAGLVLLVLDPGLLRRGAGTPDYTARIAAENQSLVVEARFDRDTGRLEVQRIAGGAPEGRDLELWLVHVEDSTTTSLGVLPRDDSGVIEVRADLIPEFEDNALALSVEPLGGSLTGQATGEVVAIGPITRP